MANMISNTLLDAIGITRAVLYRAFIEWSWRPPQPMFNVVEVQEGTSDTFELFLSQAQTISQKLDTPISLGPYKSSDSRIYIYVTHYASTFAFIGVMTRLTLSLVTFKRSAAIQTTSWTYCRPTESQGFAELSNVLVVGVQGSTAPLEELIRDNGIEPSGTVERIKDVRGRSQGTYLVFREEERTAELLEEFRGNGGDIVIYNVATFE